MIIMVSITTNKLTAILMSAGLLNHIDLFRNSLSRAAFRVWLPVTREQLSAYAASNDLSARIFIHRNNPSE